MRANKSNVKAGSILSHRDFGQYQQSFWYAGKRIQVTRVTEYRVYYTDDDQYDESELSFNIEGIGDFDIIGYETIHPSSDLDRLKEIKKKIDKLKFKLEMLQDEECRLKRELEIN